jgi:hypothetical protein
LLKAGAANVEWQRRAEAGLLVLGPRFHARHLACYVIGVALAMASDAIQPDTLRGGHADRAREPLLDRSE